MVEYVATFTLWKPVHLSKASGVLLYAVPNRGNHLLLPAFHHGGDPGDGFFFQRGDILLSSGWQGDLPEKPDAETITVPVAKNPDGPSIIGPVLARFSNMPVGAVTLSLPATHASARLDTAQATLTRRTSEDGAATPVPASDWVFADCRNTPFPGKPDPTRISLKGGFDPTCLYELTYTAKDPLVSGWITIQPPIIKQTIPSLVPKVDADGNEVSGIPSVLHQAPLGTYLGWNVLRSGFYKGKAAGFVGGYIPFARTKAERIASGDPRPSLEERYHDHAGYVAAVQAAADRLTRERFLLPDDATRLVHEAESSDVLR